MVFKPIFVGRDFFAPAVSLPLPLRRRGEPLSRPVLPVPVGLFLVRSLDGSVRLTLVRLSSRRLCPSRRRLPLRLFSTESSSRRCLLDDARVAVTLGMLSPDPRSSSRSGSSRSDLRGRTPVIRIPSTSCSVSTRRRSPTETPSGIRRESTAPRGSRAPTARQVQLPSSRQLVSSISIRDTASNVSGGLAALWSRDRITRRQT